MAKRMLIFLAVLLAFPVLAQEITLTVTKSGSDVVLTWTGGSAPYGAYKSRRPRMTGRTAAIAYPATSPTTDAGAVTDGIKIWFYQVCSPGPTITVTTPQPDFTSATPCVSASGTAPTAVHVYVNSTEATLDEEGNWSLSTVPLAIAADPLRSNKTPVLVSAVDANGNWSFEEVDGSYTGVVSTERHQCRQRKFGR